MRVLDTGIRRSTSACLRVIRCGVLVLGLTTAATSVAQDCFESRQNASKVTVKESADGQVNVKCSETTGGVLWWGDPYDATVPMGEMPIEADYDHGEAVVKSRTKQLAMFPVCGTACHNGTFPPPNDDKTPRTLTMHTDVVPDATNLQHGRGAIWCLDCHHSETRNHFTDHSGNLIDMNEPQKLCGKCHGPAYRDWRGGLHGKRIGEWASTGKKRWFVCTECHNPHDVQQGERNSGFAQLESEPAPRLPKGLENADHERHHGGH
ncbi:MAG: hypothetical protein QF921_02360 [Pseudomonadales bacterium]|jgi:hypothetical protein|nr:hypothetical protein [Pseudomonadales bacterium]MDP6472204.1 hypothetical protein [Pseudomonadales bacterium]MDP6826544.1 hypothetical protein [Pseudomonadales bacterium]MDP6970352.1 hypothetical protein [Pseudomonadales bacterium]|tara:strand:+ start:2009 stop:2800 length:792 start_codon:yes stop_codon:yes gene_type:complete